MSRIHPTESKVHDGGAAGAAAAVGGGVGHASSSATLYTVWKKSSMGFQGTDGFSVYDGAGRLAFRVDNYSRQRKFFAGELLLMDGQGTALLALRPQILSMHDQWNCYRVTEECCDKRSKSLHLFSMRRCSILQSSDGAEVYMTGSAPDHSSQPQMPNFRIEGCFRRRSCKIQGSNGDEVARISRKKAGSASVMLGTDVFSLIVQAGVDCATIMAFVIVMDRICQKPYTPLMCSS